MKRLTALLLLVPVLVLAKNNENVPIQTDELVTWSCDFGAVVSTASVAVTVIGDTPVPPPTPTPTPVISQLVSTPVVGTCANASTANTCVIWNFDGSKVLEATYQVHILATMSDGQKLACDGRVKVEDVELEF